MRYKLWDIVYTVTSYHFIVKNLTVGISAPVKTDVDREEQYLEQNSTN